MSRLVYNAALLVGLAGIGAGVCIEFGTARALVTGGALVIALTLVGAWLEAR